MARHFWQHGRLDDVLHEGARIREPAPQEDVHREKAQGPYCCLVPLNRPSRRHEMVKVVVAQRGISSVWACQMFTVSQRCYRQEARLKAENVRIDYLLLRLRDMNRSQGFGLEYIQPGKPQHNAYMERFNRTVRYEWLSQHYWAYLQEVQMLATQWVWKNNHDRPNMVLGGITPKQRLTVAE